MKFCMVIFRIFALLLTGAAISSCTTASGPAPRFSYSGEMRIGKCGGYTTLNLTSDPILPGQIQEGKKFCARYPKEPCLDLIIKSTVNEFIYRCKELE